MWLIHGGLTSHLRGCVAVFLVPDTTAQLQGFGGVDASIDWGWFGSKMEITLFLIGASLERNPLLASWITQFKTKKRVTHDNKLFQSLPACKSQTAQKGWGEQWEVITAVCLRHLWKSNQTLWVERINKGAGRWIIFSTYPCLLVALAPVMLCWAVMSLRLQGGLLVLPLTDPHKHIFKSTRICTHTAEF